MNDIWLAHHGILGQRWGVRRFQNKDGTYTSAGKKRYGDRDSNKEKFWTDDRKKLAKRIAIGTAAVAGIALASYGTYKLYQNGKLDPLIDKFRSKGENKAKELAGEIVEFKDATEQKPAIKKLQPDRIPKDINDCFDDLEGNPLKKRDDTSNTCTNVFMAAIARMRGYDCVPGFQKDSSGKFVCVDPDKVLDCFKPKTDALGNSELKSKLGSFFSSFEKAEEQLKRFPEGSYGYIDAKFSIRGKETRHAMMWQHKNGRIIFGDGINGLKAKTYFNFIMQNELVNYFRCDNKEFDGDKFTDFVCPNIPGYVDELLNKR